MVKRFAFAVPGDLATPTGGYAYDRRMIAELGRLGWQIDLVDLGDGFPLARAKPRAQLHERSSSPFPQGRTVVSMGLRLEFCQRRRRSFQSEIRCWRWCIIRWLWKSGLSAEKPRITRE